MSEAAQNLPVASSGALRFPVLPGRAPSTHGIDTTCDAYKAGFRDAAGEFAQERAVLEQSHEAFTREVGAAIEAMEARYREEALTLITRLFAAVAPALARQSALVELNALVGERVTHSDDELKLSVHPDLLSHLPEKTQRHIAESPKIVLEMDETCAASSIEARWSKGGFVSDPDALIKEILSTLGCEEHPQEEPENER